MSFRSLALVAPLVALSSIALAGIASPANASAMTFKEHDSFDPTGTVFACEPTDLVVTSGMVRETFAGAQDANGVVHFTGTIVPKNVTLTDGTNTYTLSGATWFGSTASSPDPEAPPTVATETDHFVIRNADGGVYAKVQIVMHQSPNGNYYDFDRGSCEAPAD
ncbi:MAG TPA: hypothetical protein VFK34_08285 [Marmoricola sp.]|jgi:hypothetical protein|nr:hypothetical protein [Marmoricola sp.]